MALLRLARVLASVPFVVAGSMAGGNLMAGCDWYDGTVGGGCQRALQRLNDL